MPINSLSSINLNTANGLQWLTYRSLEERDIIHGSFLRKGGFSDGIYASLNLADNVGDDLNAVLKNRQALTQALSIDQLNFAEQVHGSNYTIVDSPLSEPAKDCDVLITSQPHIAIAIKHADCQAAIIYDPEHHVIAGIHAGWKGLCKNIYKQTIHTLTEKFASNPNNLICTISPSLGPCHSEFINYKNEFPKALWHHASNSCHMNLWNIALEQLQEAKIPKDNISLTQLCTYEHPDLFYSYRYNKQCGRMVTVAMLPGQAL